MSDPEPPDPTAAERSPNEWSRVVRQQAAVAQLGQAGLRGGDIETLMAECVLAVTRALEVGTAILLDHRRSSGQLRGRSLVVGGVVLERSVAERVAVPDGYASMPGYTVEHGAAVMSRDLDRDDRFIARAGEYGLAARSAITAPVGSGAQPWGVLAVFSDAPSEWSDDDVHFVQSMANTVGLAIARDRVEVELRDSTARLGLSLAAGGLGTWTWDLRSDDIVMSAQALTIYGAGGFDGTGDGLLALVHPEDRQTLRGDVYERIQTTGEIQNVYRSRPDDTGEVRWVEALGRVVEDDHGPARVVGVVADITERRRADDRRDGLLLAEQAARASAEQARERITFLAEAGARLTANLDPALVLSTLPELCVPWLADVCLVDLLDDGGHLEEVASGASQLGVLEVIHGQRRSPGERTSDDDAVWDRSSVARGNRSVLLPIVGEAEMRAATTGDEQLDAVRSIGIQSVMVVPLVARGQGLGALTLMTVGSGRRFDRQYLALAEQLAARAALAIENGRLFESRNRVARSLQAALLPPRLPSIDGLDLAARYQVAEGDLEIGGDFYDVMELADGAWGVVIGDVCGRGPDAAALTGLMRHSVRASVVRETRPSRILAQTNDAVLDQIDEFRFCTAAYLRVELSPELDGSVRLRASSAGHPRPAVLRADGSVELIACAGVLLGVVAAPALVDVELDLGPGDVVVLYTDGVTEARRDGEFFGDEGLRATLAGLAGRSAAAVADGLEQAVREFQDGADDDRAILVLRSAPSQGSH